MTNITQPSGMVDHLDSRGAGPTDSEIAFVTAYLKPGPMDPAFMVALADPVRAAVREAMATERRTRDWAQLGQYRDANAAAGKANEAVKAVFIGDSITEFWAAADPDFFASGIVGRGISGQTSPQLLLRFMADVIALKPRVVHLLCGGNDMAGNTGPSTPADYQNNVLAMIALAQAHGIKVILGSITPANGFPWLAGGGVDPRARLAQLNGWLKQLADQRGLVWADYHSVLKTADDALRPELTRDGVHPVAAGYALMRPVAEAALAAALR